MYTFADREVLTSAATISTMAVIFGCLSQFMHRGEPDYLLGYALITGGVILLLVTLVAGRDRRMLRPLRYLLGAILAGLLLSLLFGLPSGR